MRQKIQTFSVIFILIFIYQSAFAQPANLRGDYNSWGCTALIDRGVVRAVRIQETSTGSRAFKFDNDCAWGTDWANGANISFNTRNVDALNTGQGNSSYSATNGNYYTFIVEDATSNLDISILETTYSPH